MNNEHHNDTPEKKAAVQNGRGDGVPVVALGASAGGLEALKGFFAAIPEDSRFAYVVLVHTSRDHPTLLPELLSGVAAIPVVLAEEGAEITAGTAYVVPPGNYPVLVNNTISLKDLDTDGVAMPIDLMFRAIAEELGERMAAIILSGNNADGSLGIRKVKEVNGIVLVQDEDSAAFKDMPRNAIKSGLVDHVLPPREMPDKLRTLFDGIKKIGEINGDETDKKATRTICSILESRLGHDFSGYKPNSMNRRIVRRMSVNHMDDLQKYAEYLRQSPEETEILFRELLIGVTQFFRDPEAFEELKALLVEEILPSCPEEGTFRVWVPGCSTGEEAYSLAILLHECFEQLDRKINLQIFATDLDERAIGVARRGTYPESILADVSRDRLTRYFDEEGDDYRIKKRIRDQIVFSLQNLLRDPPFSRLDLLSCRNLLIYLKGEVQQKLLPLFHHTLVPDGILMLGPSESTSRFTDLFAPKVKQWKIFQRRELPAGIQYPVLFPRQRRSSRHAQSPPRQRGLTEEQADFSNTVRLAILDRFAPAAVVVDQQGEICHIQGRSGKYLEHPDGAPTNNIINLAREGLRIELSSAIRQASTTNQPVTRKRIKVRTNGDQQVIDLHVLPRPTGDLQDYLLVAFVDIDEEEVVSADTGNEGGTHHAARLEDELLRHRENHRATVEELDTANEELKSTNEELQSTNEELQSTNEELESSKEELQSLNEELQTLNAELQDKVDELSASHDDMRNLLNSTHIATLFVDNEQRVRRFTEEVRSIINLIHSDIGRPLRHVVTNIEDDDISDDLSRVIKDLISVSREVRTSSGDWYDMRIVPYRSRDNRIEGAVITFNNINSQKTAQEHLRETKEKAQAAWSVIRHAFDMNNSPLAVLDRKGRIVVANTTMTTLLGLDRKVVEGVDFVKLDNEAFRAVDLGTKLKQALAEETDFTTAPLSLEPGPDAADWRINGRIIREGDNSPYRILLTFEMVEE